MRIMGVRPDGVVAVAILSGTVVMVDEQRRTVSPAFDVEKLASYGPFAETDNSLARRIEMQRTIDRAQMVPMQLWNPYHDIAGQFTTAEAATDRGGGGGPAGGPRFYAKKMPDGRWGAHDRQSSEPARDHRVFSQKADAERKVEQLERRFGVSKPEGAPVGGEKAAKAPEPPAPKSKVPPDLARQADFLAGWAKKKDIVKWGGDETRFYRSGKYMAQIERKDVDALLKHGLAEGDRHSFRMKPEARRPRTKEERQQEREAALD